MSILMGKNLIKKSESYSDSFTNNLYKAVSDFGLEVRYIKGTDSFKFKGYRVELEEAEKKGQGSWTFKEIGINKHELVVKADVLLAMIAADKSDKVCNRFKIGYKTQEKICGMIGDIETLRSNEMQFIKSFIISLGGLSDLGGLGIDEYNDLCIWQYVFLINERIVSRMRGRKKKKSEQGLDSFFSFALRSHKKNGGAVKGKKKKKTEQGSGSFLSFAFEPLEAALSRCEYNKTIATQKNLFPRFLDAYKEECSLTKTRFVYSECVSSWKERKEKLQKL